MNIGVRKAVIAASVLVVMLTLSFTLYGAKTRKSVSNTNSVEVQAPGSQEVLALALNGEAGRAQEIEKDLELMRAKNEPAVQQVSKEAAPEAVKTEPVKEPETKSAAAEAKKTTQAAEVKRTTQVKVASRGSTTAAKTASSGTTTVAASSKGSQIVETAKQYLGRPYVYGADGPSSFDCSGLTMFVFGEVGISIPRTAKTQSAAGQYVPKNQLQPGDLVFFTTDGTGNVSHVGIYAGNGQFIHAPRTGDVVRFTSMSSEYYSSRYITARRFY